MGTMVCLNALPKSALLKCKFKSITFNEKTLSFGSKLGHVETDKIFKLAKKNLVIQQISK